MGSPDPAQNRLLAALPTDARARVFAHLKCVSLEPGQVLHEPGVAIDHVYFPVDAIVALLSSTRAGSAEVAVVGAEGLVGVASFLGGGSSLSRAVVQSTGWAFAMATKRLQDEFDSHGDFRRLALRYSQALMTQIAQTAVCNRCHTIDQQLGRWLLLSLDRLPSNELAMTQEQIANMLGVRREGVAEAAGRLQRMGVIEYARGHIQVLNRPELECLACDCYSVVKKETDRLMGP
jgi:CRP-like cAMP-binding protein